MKVQRLSQCYTTPISQKKELPQIIKEVGFDFHWDEQKVWELKIEPEKIDITELEWHFDIPFWSTPNGFYDLSAKEVIDFPDIHTQEYERAMASNTDYPIDIMKQNKRWVILDGLHRLVKLKIQKQNEIKVRKIPRESIPMILKN